MFLVTMLGAVSAAAGKGWRLVEAAPGMSNYANLYIVMALESGSFKSIAGRIMKPIAEEESRRLVEWEQRQAPVLRAHLEAAKADVKKSAKRPADASLEADARREAECERKLLRNPRLLLGSCTTAALAQSLAHMDHETGALYSPEGGDLLRVALGLFRDRGMDADLLLSGYTGEYFSQNRVSSGSPRLNEPVLSLLAMVQPIVLRETLANEAARQRGLFSRLLCVPLEHRLFEDDGVLRTIDVTAENAWASLITRTLRFRFEHSVAPIEVRCAPAAREVFREAHNAAVAWINGSHADLRPWLVRYREHCCRVALNLQIASDPASRVLTQEAAEQAVRIVHWILAQLVEAVHSQRTDTLRERIGEFTSLVPMEGFITLRECRRKGFSEAESRQICLLEPRLFELYEHAPPSGGPLSVRIKRAGSLNGPEETGGAR
jgi:hypothetical protein